MIEVEVLYADLSKQRVEIEQADTILKSGVLSIVVQTDEEEGKKQNIAWSVGFDNYALCRRETEGRLWIMLHGWDDGDYVWRRLSNVHDNDARREVDAPLGCMNIIFRGQTIPDAKWAKAAKIIEKDML